MVTFFRNISIEDYNKHEILDIPIEKLEVSTFFKEVSERLGFETLRPMTDAGWGKLLQMEGFDYEWFNELVRVLKKAGILKLLEKPELPG